MKKTPKAPLIKRTVREKLELMKEIEVRNEERRKAFAKTSDKNKR